MKTIECSQCRRVVNIEPEISTLAHKNAGHGTIIAPNKRPNDLQCACGKYN